MNRIVLVLILLFVLATGSAVHIFMQNRLVIAPAR